MKKIILAILFIACIAFIVVGQMNWNEKVEVTTAKAYDSLGIQREVPKEKNEASEGEQPSNNKTAKENQHQDDIQDNKPNSSKEESKEATETEANQKSLLDIKRSYYSHFESLEQKQKSNANSIVSSAILDLQKVKNGEMTLGELQGIYHAKAQSLETETDEIFNGIYSQLQEELEANGYSKADAEEFRLAYNQKKSSYRNQVIREISKLQ